ncbi:hypothetical protein VOLCADRAFT_116802 [Volvox carteri f. nagariensis]|uniref:Uncharacterized protein n=1 Tax=Volvox carteri f. nagariensis TaxID=3068 RepID=D8TPK0_VOLCA|nr:uncharacterized protein VOLCADRAFT_116802 [Volvox carteri f. nagariensis]EFJ50629.1 hypothetical protein VOLCADRAFT_116802 [Volvox carteri f. nagariensis]|eukprot:XP_002948222.1 hypothetical protein VOLCADRAFT_116802 [Volvox carteri f. nagariensis]
MTATAQDEPIVEEPDDEPSPQDRASQRQRRHSPPRQPMPHPQVAPMDPFSQLFGALTSGTMGGGGSSFMLSSSSYGTMGPGGVTYQASRTTRVGPGGVRETQSVVRDGRSGTESVTISRGLGDGRQRTLVRTRDAITGREEQLEDLQGLREHEAEVFDEQWRMQAERNFPLGGGFGAAGRLAAGGGRASGAAQQRPLALPHATAAPATMAEAGPSSSTNGVHGNAGLSAAQRATYARPPSTATGRAPASSGGNTFYAGNTAAAGNGGRGGTGYSGSGAHYGGTNAGAGYSAPRGRDPMLDGQYGISSQPHANTAARLPSGSGAGFSASGGHAHSRGGY